MPLISDYQLLEIDGNGFEIKISFNNPLYISTGDEPDLVLIQIELGEFKDSNGQSLPLSVVKYIQIPL